MKHSQQDKETVVKNSNTQTWRQVWVLLALFAFLCSTLTLQGSKSRAQATNKLALPHSIAAIQQEDSLRFPVQTTGAKDYRFLEGKHPLDLKTPKNISTSFVYDEKTNTYLLITKLGNKQIGTAIPYTPEEYVRYMQRDSVRRYFIEKERADALAAGRTSFNPLDMTFDLGPAEKLFGPGGVKLRTQGSAELNAGMQSNATDNPSLPERQRRHSFFDFNEQIQMNVQASVGTKLNFGMNYNTQATFNFDSKKLKLAYEGEDDDIVKLIEAGNVSINPRNSLIKGGASLFGIHSKLQFGKLDVDMVISQQEAETKTVNTKGGAQTTPFEFSAAQYDENRHFLLGHYHREMYQVGMSTLPFISSGIKINRVEVWITNKRGNFNEARNIVAFTDLAEPQKTFNPNYPPTGASNGLPANNANSLYAYINSQPALRRIDQVTQTLAGTLQAGTEYEKLESARRLNENEYTVNNSLGFISLNTRLGADEVLAVAYEYTYGGQVFQVGEFSTDKPDNSTDNLFVKLLKGTAQSPSAPYWDYMMKNVYLLGTGVYNVQPDKFRLNIFYQSDSTGVYQPYLNEGKIKGQMLLRVLDLDKLDHRKEKYPDGIFDYVEGFTVLSQKGVIIFPTLEPFGSTLAEKLADQVLAQKYCFFELYDTTSVAAMQVAEKNKYVLRGEYKASTSNDINLGAMNVTPGSVVVTAAGAKLTENVDYIVDYTSGSVQIINESILAAGTPISVSLENRGMMNMQRKTMLGLDLNYNFSKDFSIGATVMHLSEMPLTTKTLLGDESLKNTLWGVNLNYRGQAQWLTNILDAIPFLELTKPSEITFNAEFAHLIPGHYESKYAQGHSYLDDFETSQSYIDLMNPYSWMLSATPFQDGQGPILFPEASLTNNIEYSKHRSLINWFYIDPLFNRERSSLTPAYIKNDPEFLSNHFVREVLTEELFPYRDKGVNQHSYLHTMLLTYYPSQRGPYNFNTAGMLPSGHFSDPKSHWGGIMRKIDQSDFEASNMEYIEFWLMDPFVHEEGTAQGGDLYINLGEVSEDVLRDEKKFFENGMPINDDPLAIENTVWGKVPKRQGTGYAFDNSPGAREKQDVGLDGLSNNEETTFPTHADYLQRLTALINGETMQQWSQDPYSPINDPSGDNFHHFRGNDYDDQKLPILDRYKRYNGVEGNSAEIGDSNNAFNVASRLVPDVEDINQDNTLNEIEKYFEYKISLRPSDLEIGQNNIVDKRTSTVTFRNGKQSTVNWYQFKIPVRKYDRKIGGISDFKTIRFMRMYLTQFDKDVVLRFGTLKLVRGDWRQYERELHPANVSPISTATLDVSTVNIEENGDRKPVNYVLPPGVRRSLDPQQTQSTQQNEQSMSLKVVKLAPGDARAVYKNTGYDLRRYRRMQLFTHAEQLPEDDTNTGNGELSVFIRLGTDYRNNYYEYSIPLKLTPFGLYNTMVVADQEKVWPRENMFDIALKELTDLKVRRNREKALGNPLADFYKVFSEPAPSNNSNTISVIGNPSLSDVKTIMIGVRNNSIDIKSAEVWVNELRMTEYEENSGWAANAMLNMQLSDLGALNMRGEIITSGFGALDQSLSQRALDDTRRLNLSTNLELGKFFPEKAQVSIPFFYAISDETITPQYNPVDQDIKLKDALEALPNKAARDSLNSLSLGKVSTKSLSLTNMKVNIKSKTPMPYDPANFSFSYAYNKNERRNPDVEYNRQIDWRAGIMYDYSPLLKPLKPFSFIKSKSKSLAFIKDYSINPLPSKITLETSMIRSYQEEQIRNYIPGVESADKLPVTFMQNFMWNRSLIVNWNPISSVKLSFRSGTNARIEEPHVQVNKALNPDDYKLWQDSVMQSIRELGTPFAYDQTATLTYTLPTSAIPALNWISGQFAYNSSYNWDRGAISSHDEVIGNTIRNQASFDLPVQLNLTNLYRKIGYLRQVEQRMSGTKQNIQIPKPVSSKVMLKRDTSVTIAHKFNSKKLRVSAVDSKGNPYPLEVKMRNKNSIEILNRDSVELTVTVGPRRTTPPNPVLQAITDRFVYTLMMVKNFNVSYKQSKGLNLPGFLPNIKAAGGQGSVNGLVSPGLDFAFGFIGEDYVEHAANNGWLVSGLQNVSPAVFSRNNTIDIRATIEPIRELRIALTANRTETQQTETQYMYAGMPRTYGGSFMMTTIGLRNFFAKPKASDGYASQAFSNFLSYRDIIAARVLEQYAGGHYPNGGFFSGSSYAGQAIDPNSINLPHNSAEVLIPAFLAAYTQNSPNRVGLSPFPALKALLPNWSITYTGLSRIESLKKYFRNVRLSHTYRSTYSVDGYSSYLGWQGLFDDSQFGFVQDQNSEPTSISPNPSMPYDIPGVRIEDRFAPFFGLELTLNSGLGVNAKYNKARNLNLNLSAYQLIESNTEELSLGMSYKIDDFLKLIGLKNSKRRGPRKSANAQNTSSLTTGKAGESTGGGMTIRVDYSFNRTSSLIRKIQENYTLATQGNAGNRLSVSADYNVSRMLNLRFYYDWDSNRPLVNNNSFPIRNSKFGLSFRFNLTQ